MSTTIVNEYRVLLVEDRPDDANRIKPLIESMNVGGNDEMRVVAPGHLLNGMKWLPELRRMQPNAAIVVLTAYPYEKGLENAVRAVRDFDADDFIPKTLEWNDMEARIKLASAHAVHRRQVRMLRDELFRSLLRSRGTQTFAEDIAIRVNEAQYRLDRLADIVESGDASAIDAVPGALRRAAGDLGSAISDLAAKLQHPREEKRSVTDFKDFLENLVRLFGPFPTRGGVSAIFQPENDGPIGCTTYLGDLKTALYEVIQNAVDAFEAGSGGDKIVEFGLRRESRLLQIIISDTAGGFTAEALDHRFELGFTTRQPQLGDEGRNRGMGLYIARRMAQGLGGDVSIENRADAKGARVTITIRDFTPV